MLTNETRSLLDHALKIYSDREFYSPEKARALYKKGKLLSRMAMEGNDSEKCFNGALDLYQKLKKENADLRKEIDQLTDVDFDRLIVFWSK